MDLHTRFCTSCYGAILPFFSTTSVSTQGFTWNVSGKGCQLHADPYVIRVSEKWLCECVKEFHGCLLLRLFLVLLVVLVHHCFDHLLLPLGTQCVAGNMFDVLYCVGIVCEGLDGDTANCMFVSR